MKKIFNSQFLTYWVIPLLIAVIIPYLAMGTALFLWGPQPPITETQMFIPWNITIGVFLILFSCLRFIFFVRKMRIDDEIGIDTKIGAKTYLCVISLIGIALVSIWNIDPTGASIAIGVFIVEIIASVISMIVNSRKNSSIRYLILVITCMICLLDCRSRIKASELQKIQSHADSYTTVKYFFQSKEKPIELIDEERKNLSFQQVARSNGGDTIMNFTYERDTITCQKIPVAGYVFKKDSILALKRATRSEIAWGIRRKLTYFWQLNIIIP